jgi:hypothetical protein
MFVCVFRSDACHGDKPGSSSVVDNTVLISNLWNDSQKVYYKAGRGVPAIVLMRNARISMRYHTVTSRIKSGELKLDDEQESELGRVKENLSQVSSNIIDQSVCKSWEQMYKHYSQACRLNWGGDGVEAVISVGVRDNANMSIFEHGFLLVDIWMKLAVKNEEFRKQLNQLVGYPQDQEGCIKLLENSRALRETKEPVDVETPEGAALFYETGVACATVAFMISESLRFQEAPKEAFFTRWGSRAC